MDKSLQDEIISRRNDMLIKRNVKKINPTHTLKIESPKKRKNDEYLTIGEEDFDYINNIYKKTLGIEGSVKLSLLNINKNGEQLNNLKRLMQINIEKSNKNTKGLVYLGLFVFFSQVIVTSVSNYLMLEVFNN